MPGGGISNAGATGTDQRQTADLKSVSLLRLGCGPGDSMREIHGLRALLSHFRNEKNLGNQREAWSRGATGKIAIPRLEERQAHRAGRFGAKDARAQATADGSSLAESVGLVIAQAAFGAHHERGVRAGRGREQRLQRLGRTLPQTDEKAERPALREPRAEAHGLSDLWNDAAAALLGRLLGDALPARDSRGRAPRLHAHDGTRGGQGNDARDAQLGGHADDPLHLLALRNALGEHEAAGRLARRLLASEDGALGATRADPLDPHGQHATGSVESFDHRAHAESQHAREMAALLGVECDARPRDGLRADVKAAHAATARRRSPDQPSITSFSARAKPAPASASATSASSCSRMPPRMRWPPGATRRRYRSARARWVWASRLARTSGKGGLSWRSSGPARRRSRRSAQSFTVAFRRAAAMASGSMSRPSTRMAPSLRQAMARMPVPVPMSRTRSGGASPTAASSRARHPSVLP